jgi:hypothetical protein
VINRLSEPTLTPSAPPSATETSLPPTATPTPQIIGAEAIGGSADCAPISNETYDMLQVNSAPTDRPAEFQADLNLRMRSYAPVSQFKGLVDYDGPVDGTGPQLYSLFANQRTATIASTYEVYDWNWGTNSRGALVTYPDVTLIGLRVEPGETIYAPQANLDIGLGHKAMVLYASANRLTLKFTREDNVVDGYALHLEGLCVESRLVAQYQQANDAGRGSLPALRAGQAIGRASGAELGVAVRDRGAFMDPRSRKNWWIGR